MIPIRVLDLHRYELSDPAVEWETPGVEADLRTYASLRRAAYPLLPTKLSEDMPEDSLAALEAAVGTVRPGDVVVVPRTPRPVPGGGWVVTPTSVLGIGADDVALWIGEPTSRVVTTIPMADVAAVFDLTILLYGRLEIVGPEASIVMRYNTVGREEMRAMTLAIRRTFAPAARGQGAGGPIPDELPHKWMAVLKSREALPRGHEPRWIVVGEMGDPDSAKRDGIATMSATELLVAVEPELAGGVGLYGTDLIAVPRTRLAGVAAAAGGIDIDVSSGSGEIRVRVPAHHQLAAAVAAAFGSVPAGV
jgi:hypothetical protein